MMMNDKRCVFEHDGYKIYSHPGHIEDERMFSVCGQRGEVIMGNRRDLEDAKEDLFVFVQTGEDVDSIDFDRYWARKKVGDDGLLDAIGADESSRSVDRAIDKEYGEVMRGVRSPGLDQVLVGGPGGGERLMKSMGVNKGSVSSGFGTDMSYVKSVTKTDNNIFKNMARV